MRAIGLDVGSKTIGVAVSDLLGLTAQGLTTIIWDENDMTSADAELSKIIAEYEVNHIVIGLPRHMNGTVGARGEISEIYANRLRKIHRLPVSLLDERLTTMEAERILIDADVSRKKRKKVIDKMAASIILQNYLDQAK